MPYVTSVEQIGIEKGLEEGIKRGREEGRQEGLVKGIATVLKVRFGDDANQLMARIREIVDDSVLETLLDACSTADSVEDLLKLITKS